VALVDSPWASHEQPPRLVTPLAPSPQDEVVAITALVKLLSAKLCLLVAANEACQHPASRGAAVEGAERARRWYYRLAEVFDQVAP
jgi:hypothetical protein